LQTNHDDISVISRLIYDLCGLTLDTSKGYLIESRLGPVLQASGCTSFAELAFKARSPENRSLQIAIIDAITTQETLFFRDKTPFDVLQYKVLPDLIDARARCNGAKRLRILSAACSTGQEPYSIAMTICETIPDLHLWDVNILGIDISNEAVRRASQGCYTSHEIQRGMKPELLNKYFQPNGKGWKIKDEVRAMVSFARRNLLQPLTDLGPFEIIFCRNVAIYFDAQTRRDLFFRLAERLTPHGYLFTGSSECLSDLGPRFIPRNYCRGTYYQPALPALQQARIPTELYAATAPIFQKV